MLRPDIKIEKIKKMKEKLQIKNSKINNFLEKIKKSKILKNESEKVKR